MPSQLTSGFGAAERRRARAALITFAIALVGVVLLLNLLFHAIMFYEGRSYSWASGFYWVLTVMSTLGFGDIVFNSDLGRMFSMVVLLYGIVMLLVVAPFTIIRFFYAPWLEARVRPHAPQALADHISGHVVLCRYDDIARGLLPRLVDLKIPYVILEPDTARAAALHAEGLHVVEGDRESGDTLRAVRVQDARLVLANLGDAENTNLTLTVRDIAPEVPIIAMAREVEAVEVLRISGATEVVPLKQRLGEQLSSRVRAGNQSAYRIGRFGQLIIAEFPVHGTKLPGRTVEETRLHELTGIDIIAVWEHGRFFPASPDTRLTDHSVLLVAGAEEQVTELDALFVIYQPQDAPVLVVGGGTVGKAVCRALRRRGARVTIIERAPALAAELEQVADRVVIGDAGSLSAAKEAGIDEAPSVVLTTNDDAVNIFLAVYCRKQGKGAHIISRVAHSWNLEAIHLAGADFVLSGGSLAVQVLISALTRRDLIVVDEGAELFTQRISKKHIGKPLSQILPAAEDDVNVIGIISGGRFFANPAPETEPGDGDELVMIGGESKRRPRALKLLQERRPDAPLAERSKSAV